MRTIHFWLKWRLNLSCVFNLIELLYFNIGWSGNLWAASTYNECRVMTVLRGNKSKSNHNYNQWADCTPHYKHTLQSPAVFKPFASLKSHAWTPERVRLSKVRGREDETYLFFTFPFPPVFSFGLNRPESWVLQTELISPCLQWCSSSCPAGFIGLCLPPKK